jgi:hypothetical protein
VGWVGVCSGVVGAVWVEVGVGCGPQLVVGLGLGLGLEWFGLGWRSTKF